MLRREMKLLQVFCCQCAFFDPLHMNNTKEILKCPQYQGQAYNCLTFYESIHLIQTGKCQLLFKIGVLLES